MRIPIPVSPIQDIAREHRAVMGDRGNWRVVQNFGAAASEARAARERVVLADETPNGKLLAEGGSLEPILQTGLGVGSLSINNGAQFDRGLVYRLRNDLFFISTVPNSVSEVAERIEAVRDRAQLFVTITDVTHGNAELRVIGPSSRALLSKLCGLDFDPRAFPNHSAKQSSLAKTVQLIVRRDIGTLPAFSIIGARSLGAYIWETILRAGQEFEIAPIGTEAVQMLEQVSPLI